MKKVVFSEKKKLKRLIVEAAFTPTRLARTLGVSYKTVYRWLNTDIAPQPGHSHRIDELFKEKVDITPVVYAAKKAFKKEPLTFLKQNKSAREKFFLELTYHSNALAGNRLSQKQIKQSLKAEDIRGRSFSEQLEAINYYNVLLSIFESIKPGFNITEKYIQLLHSSIFYGLTDKMPGHYRTRAVALPYTDKPFPEAEEVPRMIKKLIKIINDPKVEIIKKTAITHYHFESIQPFSDGNGRTGRLIMVVQLLSNGFMPAMIRTEDKGKYLTSIEKCDNNDFGMLTQLICEGILTSFEFLK